MNWKRLYALVQATCLVWGSAVGAGVIIATLVTGLCRFAFNLDEKPAMLFVFCPLCLVLVVYWVRRLPSRLRKAGMISDKPDKFGPWFKS
jgi:hypothetical protein